LNQSAKQTSNSPAQTSSELPGDAHDENQVIYNIFSAFAYFAQGGIGSEQCTKRPNTSRPDCSV